MGNKQRPDHSIDGPEPDVEGHGLIVDDELDLPTVEADLDTP